ncbi:hypothetical protein PRIPAC_78738 [Pristionchus pacificus]|uniref:Uncharacterized protein n=1 Tax=Pristionchus pacificus TaxID=54126 RepID=A0A2A6BHN6_PRIPA|nr:hypothetical protein PRIPAC_78738 [Pristionchus pacificus]|eukprot:PDM65420.1 hypothetical protein PRIPAC_52362 [Pristionchus pacificus]
MRLLSFTLLLLSIALSSLAAPTEPTAEDPKTSIETVWYNVTKTIIHTVTEPSVAEKPACACPEEPVTNEEPTVLADAPAATLDKCTCEVSEACRKESLDSMDKCMDECDSTIEYGNSDKLEDYRKCFTKNSATVVESEKCLFEDMKDHCTTANTTETIEEATFEAPEYKSESGELKNNTVWKRHGEKYDNLQTFFHCTKNCIHKKLQECTANKKCALQLPKADEFAAKMIKCTKNSLKISNALLNTCTCLAWTNGVKELQGSCAVIGNSYYVNKA